jgi:hypothetical protein
MEANYINEIYEGGATMIQNKKKAETEVKPTFNLQPLQELKGFDFAASDAMVCDMETGVCGPANQEEEKK